MNVSNNKRRQATREKIEKVFIELLQEKEISQISVSEIVKISGFNRSTFYANYVDIYNLADKLRDKLMNEVNSLYENDLFGNCGNDYLKLFRHIRDNQIFYNTYFKLGYDGSHAVDLSILKEKQNIPDEYLDYHVEFHRAGLNAIIKKWLLSGCRETPEDMVKIIKNEYAGRKIVFWG